MASQICVPAAPPVRRDYVNVVKKLWGTEFWIENNERYCLKRLVVLQGRACSLHYHRQKDETFFVDSGHCDIELPDGLGGMKKTRFETGDRVRIPPGTPHRFSCPRGDSIFCTILEVSTTHSDDDVVRLEDSKLL